MKQKSRIDNPETMSTLDMQELRLWCLTPLSTIFQLYRLPQIEEAMLILIV